MPNSILKSKKSQPELVKIGNNKPCNLSGIDRLVINNAVTLLTKKTKITQFEDFWKNETLKSISLKKKSQSEPVKIGNNKPCNLIGIDTLVINNWSRAVYNHNYLPVNSRVDKTSNTQFELWRFGFTLVKCVNIIQKLKKLSTFIIVAIQKTRYLTRKPFVRSTIDR